MTTRTALTPNAKLAITAAELITKDGREHNNHYLHTLAYPDIVAELISHGLAEDLGGDGVLRPFRYVLTDAGVIVRRQLEHRTRLQHLADEIQRAGITSGQLAVIAQRVDAGKDDNMISVNVALSLALVASLADRSAEQVRVEVLAVLGWQQD